ncbi:MAG: hypothetical protein D6744_11765 [Planctomycetota bacterium]|nr:MAG: hypothetical protein D6744_11765 [Planctomycetota bacterium]
MTDRQFEQLLARWRNAPDDLRLIERLDAAIRRNRRFRNRAADFLLDEHVLRAVCASPCRIRWAAFRRRLRDCIANTTRTCDDEPARLRSRSIEIARKVARHRRRLFISAIVLLLAGVGIWLGARCYGV